MTTVLAPSRGLLAAAAPDLATHLRRHGPLPAPGAGVLLDELRRSGLTGRGGAGFPLWRKLDALTARPGSLVVANGAEGEPDSAKDRTLLRGASHLVLDGLQAAAVAARASAAVVYVGEDSADAVRAALAERSGDPVGVRVVVAPPGFLSGEETAVVNVIDGRPARPRDKAVRITERGAGGRATAVANVETLAHAALVARHGAEHLRASGTRREPGTMLVTVSGAAPSVVREVPLGAPLAEAIGGPVTGPVLVGGLHGAWLARSDAAGARLSRAGLAPFGASPGAGVLLMLPPGSCGLLRTARMTEYLAGSAAGRCGPCRNGLPAMADVLRRVAGGDPDPALRDEALRLAGLVRGRGACHHPDGTARLVVSALRVFAADAEAHRAGHCLAGGAR